MGVRSCLKELVTEYTTTRLVNIRSPVIAITNLLLLTMVWSSLLGGIKFDVRKLYQTPCPVTGIVLSKVKGFASTEHLSDDEIGLENPELYQRVWDPPDLIFPNHGGEGEAGSFLIVTNVIITPNQSRGLCAESADSSHKASCQVDSDCTPGYWSHTTHGIFTGKCDQTEETCEIKGWCPIAKDELPRNGTKPLLEDIQSFTLMLRNTVEFPGCGHKTGRLLKSDVTKEFIRNCSWEPDKDPTCPVFKIGDIVKYVGDTFDEVAIRGAVYRIKVLWDCDFDFGKTTDDCPPTFKFLRVDDKKAMHSKGWNFRAADYYHENKRTLRKYFAIKILIDLEGEGREFNFFLFGTNLGATIGFFSLCPLFCDTLLDIFNFLGKLITKTTGKDCSIFHDVASRYLDDDTLKKLRSKAAVAKSSSPTDIADSSPTETDLSKSAMESTVSFKDSTPEKSDSTP